MPVVSRRYLRQTLGVAHVRDTRVGTTTATGPAIVDARLADLTLSGQETDVGAWIKHQGMELRVASFNAGSGAYVHAMIAATLVASGAEYERHTTLPPSEKDKAIDEAIKQLRVRREVVVAGVADLDHYPLPAGVEQVLDAFTYANPTATLDRGRAALRSFGVVETATGTEVRISPALGASQQLVLDAILAVSLGAAETATVSLPDERLVLFAAEAACWGLVARRAPRGTVGEYLRLQDAAARQYAALAKNFKIPVDRPIRFANEDA